jgi:hypothetical protein
MNLIYLLCLAVAVTAAAAQDPKSVFAHFIVGSSLAC